MARVKRGVTTRAKHKNILAQAKGYYGRRKNTIRIARKRREGRAICVSRPQVSKKRTFRGSAIQRINAGVRAEGLTYSRSCMAAIWPASNSTGRSGRNRDAREAAFTRSSRRQRQPCPRRLRRLFARRESGASVEIPAPFSLGDRGETALRLHTCEWQARYAVHRGDFETCLADWQTPRRDDQGLHFSLWRGPVGHLEIADTMEAAIGREKQ